MGRTNLLIGFPLVSCTGCLGRSTFDPRLRARFTVIRGAFSRAGTPPPPDPAAAALVDPPAKYAASLHRSPLEGPLARTQAPSRHPPVIRVIPRCRHCVSLGPDRDIARTVVTGNA